MNASLLILSFEIERGGGGMNQQLCLSFTCLLLFEFIIFSPAKDFPLFDDIFFTIPYNFKTHSTSQEKEKKRERKKKRKKETLGEGVLKIAA